MVDTLPDCRLRNRTKHVLSGPHRLVLRLNYIPLFCANCGGDAGAVPDDNIEFAFALCDPCAEKWGVLADTYLEPTDRYWQKVIEAQLAEYGRPVSGDEMRKVLDDVNSIFHKLARDKPKGV